LFTTGAASLQEVLFSVFEDGGMEVQRMLLEKAEEMARQAWERVVGRGGLNGWM
jgi:hypothetical protein